MARGLRPGNRQFARGARLGPLARRRWIDRSGADRRGGQRHSDRSIAAWREGPVERRAQIVDFRGVIREPFARRLRRRLSFGALEQMAVILGVVARKAFAL